MVFFSSRRRHTRYWRDWSSDVCSSDLRVVDVAHHRRQGVVPGLLVDQPVHLLAHPAVDRKGVVYGKSVDLGGRRIIKKKNRPPHRDRAVYTVITKWHPDMTELAHLLPS